MAGLEHPALQPAARAVPLSDCRLSDREKLSVLLQAAGLLSLLARAGRHLQVWEGSVTADGRLALDGEGPASGRSPRAVQESLGELVARLFGEGPIAGRGEARGAARRLLQLWGPAFAPLSPDEAVFQILEAAPFLWEAPFGQARRSLAGALLTGRGESPTARLWVAGPAPFRRALLAQFTALPPLQEALVEPSVRRYWVGAPGEPASPTSEEERLAAAAAQLRRGRYAAALALLAERTSPAAQVLAARCQLHLGELGAAQASLRRLARLDLTAAERVEVADVAARVFANAGTPQKAAPFLERAVAAATAGGRTALRAWLVAAGAAWDRGDLDAMDRLLADSRSALELPDLAWRWRQAAGWRAMADGGTPGAAIAAMGEALRQGRRFQTRPEAAGLWNELGVARAAAGDLGGAERAFVHAVRLESGCEGPRRSTLALYNLAEVRLRRGRLKGVREALRRSEEENRRAANLRGLTQDAELWARYELARGRPEPALAICRDALGELERRRLDWRCAELRLLAARALGWLGRPREAAAELARIGAATLRELEPEERPAVYALAGHSEEAAALAAGTPFAPLWQALALNQEPPPQAWEPLAALEPFRAARLVHDLETRRAGIVPPEPRRRAVETLRDLGATAWAVRLELSDATLWPALLRLCGEGEADSSTLASLLAAAGHPEARLSRVTGSDETAAETVLVNGAGGEEQLEEEGGRVRLRVRAAGIDVALRAVVALVARCLAQLPETARQIEPTAAEVAEDLIGENPELRSTLVRIARLATGEMPVLIQGESGTGKELAARRIHRRSRRAGAPFLAVNCAALSETLLLSDLFGHVRGAFTGAERDRKGVFEAAHGGTVFLDEIGDLPLAAQGLLLRVLQEGEIRRLGESTARRVDVRVLAATHRALEAMVEAGSFRRDLFFRLKVGSVRLPALRDRGTDVLRIADRFLARLRATLPLRLSKAARLSLVAYRWPGNVRELENVLTVAASLCEDGVIEPEHLELPEAEESASSPYHQQVEALRRRLVETALEEAAGNRAEAARKLGVSRQALSYLIKQLGIRARGGLAGWGEP